MASLKSFKTIGFLRYVITSYSIHYTKLYEIKSFPMATPGGYSPVDVYVNGAQSASGIISIIVITSYSIHYTKLYE